MKENIFITTAIDYVNSMPHLGTAYEKIGADVLARFYRMCGHPTLFLMGTDEHSLNVERKAREEGVTPQAFCDKMSEGFRSTWTKMNISFDDFIRTTEERHINSVQKMFSKMHENGDIYAGKYTGWYCVSCETFYQEKDLVDGKCPTHQKKPEWIEEENYFFRLSKYEDKLKELYENNPDFLRPDSRKNEILNVVKGGLEDISVSRSSVGWGIPLPIAPEQVVYVWFDALINYISGAGFSDDPEKFKKFWPANTHVIGKDITRFHCIIWPAMLMAAGLEIPKHVFGHGFVYLSGGKMSKSDGRVVDPAGLCEKYGSDAVRYFLMREIPFERDGDFSEEKFILRYNADLANDLGNLLNRVTNMVSRYCNGQVPERGILTDMEDAIEKRTKEIISEYEEAMKRLDFSNALKLVWELVQSANKYAEDTAPWKMAKDPELKERLHCVLYFMCEIMRKTAILILPFMPETSAKIRSQLNVQEAVSEIRFPEDMDEFIAAGTKLAKGSPLFPRIENVD